MSRQLGTMCNQIEEALDGLEIDYGEPEEWEGVVAPRSFRFNVPAVSFPIGCLTEDQLTGAISTALGVSPDSVRMGLKGSEMQVRVLRDHPAQLSLSKVTAGLGDKQYTAALGIDDKEGKPLLVRLGPDKSRNMLIAGDPDSGATELLGTIIESNVQRHPDSTIIRLGSGYLDEELNEVGRTIVDRERGEESARPVLLAIDDADVLSNERQRAMLAAILERGPGVRVHTVAVASNPEGLEPLMRRAKVDPFPIKVGGSEVVPVVFPREFVLKYQGEEVPFTAACVEEGQTPPSGRGNVIQFPIQKLLNP